MSTFSVPVVEITDPVVDHPDADRLSIIKIFGYLAISAKLEDGSHRYNQGDYVVYIPEDAVVPQWILKKLAFWDDTNQKGLLSGSKGNRVKAKRLRGIFSQGILLPVIKDAQGVGWVELDDLTLIAANPGDEVGTILGISKYEPPIPANMAGAIAGAADRGSFPTVKFDFESIQRYPNLFEEGEYVSVTEKIHGTSIQIGHIPGLNHPDCPHDLYVTSKGIGARGFIYKNSPENADNLYVHTLNQIDPETLVSRLNKIRFHWDISADTPIRLFGEVYGAGVQDLNYGEPAPKLRLFDIMVGDNFLDHSMDDLPEFEFAVHLLGMESVPLLYVGPFDRALLESLRDGNTTIGYITQIREGIVIRGQGKHPRYGRKIAKWVSPDYLTRKGNVTEFA